MLIVSQDKTKLINFNNIKEIRQIHEDYNNVEIEALINDNYTVLGKYKTTERAKEILEAIIKEYKKVLTTFNRGTGQQRFYDLPKVYYMPEE